MMNAYNYQTRENRTSGLFLPRFKSEKELTVTNAKTALLNQKIELYARSNHHILVTGERGTGKTTIAREIHNKGTRRSKPFVSLNCATLQAELIEAELFGYEKGAFTGANQLKAGLFETGSGGTVFLDEIGELSLNMQAKLLKAVEEKKIRRVGSNREIAVDLRIIAATSRNLQAMSANGEFRADLYDRLNVLELQTIPLREQRDQIRELLINGLEREKIALGRKTGFQIETSAVLLLENYGWAGNFRELHNFISKLATEFCEAEVITERDIRVLLAAKDINVTADSQIVLRINLEDSLDNIIERIKEEYVVYHLKSKSYRATVRACGISRTMIRRIVDKFDIKNQRSGQL